MLNKLILLFILLFAFQVPAQENKRPTVWGQIIKAKEETHGFKYFVYFKKEGKAYAYPLSNESEISSKQLDQLHGKYAKIYGQTNFERIELDNTKHIMTFVVSDARELKLADLNTDYETYKERMDVDFLKRKRVQTEQAEIKGLSDTAVNSAIFVGGAALAVEVLGTLLKN